MSKKSKQEKKSMIEEINLDEIDVDKIEENSEEQTEDELWEEEIEGDFYEDFLENSQKVKEKRLKKMPIERDEDKRRI